MWPKYVNLGLRFGCYKNTGFLRCGGICLSGQAPDLNFVGVVATLASSAIFFKYFSMLVCLSSLAARFFLFSLICFHEMS